MPRVKIFFHSSLHQPWYCSDDHGLSQVPKLYQAAVGASTFGSKHKASSRASVKAVYMHWTSGSCLTTQAPAYAPHGAKRDHTWSEQNTSSPQ